MSLLWTQAAGLSSVLTPMWVDRTGEYDIDTERHPIQQMPVQHLQEGDLARPHGLPIPFQRIKGPSVHDPHHPSDTSWDPRLDEDERVKMYTPNYQTRYGPHVSEGHPFDVVRGHP
jgi:hypothetical protein